MGDWCEFWSEPEYRDVRTWAVADIPPLYRTIAMVKWINMVCVIAAIHIASGWKGSSAEIQDALCRRDLQVVWTALKRGFDPNTEFTDGRAAQYTPLTL